MCPPMRAHWRHLANTIELVGTSFGPPESTTHQQIDWFSHFCTAQGTKVPIVYNGHSTQGHHADGKGGLPDPVTHETAIKANISIQHQYGITRLSVPGA